MAGTQLTSERFYTDLTTFDDFADFVEFDAYAPVPDDWIVVISDVQGSTRAIEQGRYKDVNMVGAASITAVLNACGDVAVPFVFGGDGGTLVVPGSLGQAAREVLVRLRATSEAMFGLALRVGAVPVADLRAMGTDVLVRKYELSPGNFLAMFAGGGVEQCDSLLKDDAPDNPYLLHPDDETAAPDLEGLSCRWEPLIAQNGCMMTLMVQGTDDDPAAERALLGEVISAISDILGHQLQESAPASAQSMRFRWPPKGLKLEARATAGGRSFARRYLEVLLSSLFQLWCERFDRQLGSYNAPVYRQELRANTDFRKYDGLLRTVLDVSKAQAAEIERYLERAHQAGRIVYGVHLADTALMTCLVFSLAQSEHVHFIDGGDGGFARAAVGFKARLRSR
ncbi:MAG: DUF3095 domain-containing protein [Methyloligellaceae bacterium]